METHPDSRHIVILRRGQFCTSSVDIFPRYTPVTEGLIDRLV